VIKFSVKYEKATGKCLPVAQIAWEASWQFGSFDIVAKAESNGEEVHIKNVLKRAMPQYDEPLDVSKLKPGTKYQFVVYHQNSNGSKQMLNNSSITGDTSFEIPYSSRIFYFKEDLKNGWYRIHILIDGNLPKDSLRIHRNKQKYSIPGSLPVDRIYAFRLRAEKDDAIELKAIVRTTQPIKSVDSLEALHDKCNFGGNSR